MLSDQHSLPIMTIMFVDKTHLGGGHWGLTLSITCIGEESAWLGTRIAELGEGPGTRGGQKNS